MKHTKLKNKIKNIWKKDFVLWGIVIVWTTLFWGGHRILPGAKWLSEVISGWIVILNLAIFFIFITMLMNERYLSPILIILTLIGLLITSIFLSIGYQQFPLVTIIGAGVVLLFIFCFKIWQFKYQRRE